MYEAGGVHADANGEGSTQAKALRARDACERSRGRGSVAPSRIGALDKCDTRADLPGMEYREFPPPPEAAAHVRCIWTLRGADPSGEVDAPTEGSDDDGEPALPDGSPELIFNIGAPFDHVAPDGTRTRQPHAFLVGQITRPFAVQPTGRVELLAVRFEAHGAALVCDDLAALTDRWAPIESLPASGVVELAMRTREDSRRKRATRPDRALASGTREDSTTRRPARRRRGSGDPAGARHDEPRGAVSRSLDLAAHAAAPLCPTGRNRPQAPVAHRSLPARAARLAVRPAHVRSRRGRQRILRPVAPRARLSRFCRRSTGGAPCRTPRLHRAVSLLARAEQSRSSRGGARRNERRAADIVRLHGAHYLLLLPVTHRRGLPRRRHELAG